MLEGVLDKTSSGSGYIIRENIVKDVFVSEKNISNSFDGDLVEFVMITNREAKITNIIKRKKIKFVGVTKEVDQKIIVSTKEKKDKISLATFYNTVHSFKKAGHLKEILTNNNKNYFDTNVSSHHHFFDEKNNELTDINSKEIELKNIPAAPKGKKIKDIDVIINIDNHS